MADTPPITQKHRRNKTVPVPVPVATPPKDVGMPLRYWNPDRFKLPVWCSRSRYDKYRAELREVDDRLDVTYDYDEGRWAVWVKDHRIKWKWSPGWRLLFYSDDLSDYILRKLKLMDATQYDGAMHYWRWWEGRAKKQRDKKQERDRQELYDQASDRWDYSLIKVAMRGQSSGSKFAAHHAGD